MPFSPVEFQRELRGCKKAQDLSKTWKQQAGHFVEQVSHCGNELQGNHLWGSDPENIHKPDFNQNTASCSIPLHGAHSLLTPHYHRGSNLGTIYIEKLCGHLIGTLQYLEGAYREPGEGLFITKCSDRTRSNGYKLKEKKFGLGITKKIFTLTGVRHWQACLEKPGMSIPGSVQGQAA